MNLPEGFIIDEPKVLNTSLPEGFVLDTPQEYSLKGLGKNAVTDVSNMASGLKDLAVNMVKAPINTGVGVVKAIPSMVKGMYDDYGMKTFVDNLSEGKPIDAVVKGNKKLLDTAYNKPISTIADIASVFAPVAKGVTGGAKVVTRAATLGETGKAAKLAEWAKTAKIADEIILKDGMTASYKGIQPGYADVKGFPLFNIKKKGHPLDGSTRGPDSIVSFMPDATVADKLVTGVSNIGETLSNPTKTLGDVTKKFGEGRIKKGVKRIVNDTPETYLEGWAKAVGDMGKPGPGDIPPSLSLKDGLTVTYGTKKYLPDADPVYTFKVMRPGESGFKVNSEIDVKSLAKYVPDIDANVLADISSSKKLSGRNIGPAIEDARDRNTGWTQKKLYEPEAATIRPASSDPVMQYATSDTSTARLNAAAEKALEASKATLSLTNLRTLIPAFLAMPLQNKIIAGLAGLISGPLSLTGAGAAGAAAMLAGYVAPYGYASSLIHAGKAAVKFGEVSSKYGSYLDKLAASAAKPATLRAMLETKAEKDPEFKEFITEFNEEIRGSVMQEQNRAN